MQYTRLGNTGLIPSWKITWAPANCSSARTKLANSMRPPRPHLCIRNGSRRKRWMRSRRRPWASSVESLAHQPTSTSGTFHFQTVRQRKIFSMLAACE